MKRILFAVIAIIALMPFTAAADAPAKEPLCQTCHGANGAKPILPMYPKINGQSKEYFISAVNQYKNKQRTGGMSALMMAQSMSLTDDEIAALAEYYADK